MPTSKRLFWAALLAPLMAPFVVIAQGFLLYKHVDSTGLFIVFAVASLIAYTITISLGIPLILALSKFHCLNLVTLSACGALLGMIIMLVFFNGTLYLTLLGGVDALAVSVVFGFIAGVGSIKNNA